VTSLWTCPSTFSQVGKKRQVALPHCCRLKVVSMVHVRLNERETNPNLHINFISVLDAEEEDARHLIRALAAQVKPVMKAHGFTVNSLEEVSMGILQVGLIGASTLGPLRSV
jgi:hypothetical protein